MHRYWPLFFLPICFLALGARASEGKEMQLDPFNVLRKVSEIEHCNNHCGKQAAEVLRSEGMICRKQRSKQVCSPADRKWSISIAEGAPPRGRGQYLEATLTLLSLDQRSIETLRKTYFSDWRPEIISPPEHVLFTSDSIQNISEDFIRTVSFTRTKPGSEEGTDLATLTFRRQSNGN